MSEPDRRALPKQVVTIARNDDGVLEFSVYIEVGGWWSRRTVTIQDESVSPNLLLEQIANGETTVTQVDAREGGVIVEENGRRLLVGHWEINEVEEEGFFDRNVVLTVPCVTKSNASPGPGEIMAVVTSPREMDFSSTEELGRVRFAFEREPTEE